MKVRVYWNLHKKTWSIQCCKTNNVVAHAQTVKLDNAKFVVRKAGQRKVRETGQKNVHAFIRGYLNVDEWHINYAKKMLWRRVRYNPYKDDFFMVQKFSDPTVYKEVDKDAYYAVRLETHEDKPRIYI